MRSVLVKMRALPRERGCGGLAVSGQAVFWVCLEAWRQAGYASPSGGLYKEGRLVTTITAPLANRRVADVDLGHDLPEGCPALAHDRSVSWLVKSLL